MESSETDTDGSETADFVRSLLFFHRGGLQGFFEHARWQKALRGPWHATAHIFRLMPLYPDSCWPNSIFTDIFLADACPLPNVRASFRQNGFFVDFSF